eukprot:3209902-Pyramimonas_sp.AAC.1
MDLGKPLDINRELMVVGAANTLRCNDNQSQEGRQYILRVRINRKRGGSICSVFSVPLVAVPLSSRVPLVAASDPATLARLRIPLTRIKPAHVRLTQVPLIAGALRSRL